MEVAKELLDKDTDINVKDNDGDTALFLCKFFY